MMTVFYIVMGGNEAIRYYIEAYLSIRTFQKQLSPETGRICVITDHPSFFRKAGVEVVTITAEQKAEWMGPHKFFFRTKIKGMEYLHQLYPDDNLLYLDSDTFLYGDWAKLNERLDEGHGLMHLCEGKPTGISNTARRLYKKAVGHNYGGIIIGEQHQMWNAGVVGLPNTKINETVACALMLCDGMLNDGNNEFITEQYSYSIALSEHTTLMATSDLIGHYWGNAIEWKQKATDIFMRAYLNDSSLEEELEELDINDLCQTPVYVHRSHRGQQFQSLVSRLFPDNNKRLAKDCL
jgi:hypothetical protein